MKCRALDVSRKGSYISCIAPPCGEERAVEVGREERVSGTFFLLSRRENSGL